MSNHDGHRERLRERFRKEGLANFQEHEVLELVLFYCLPRKDTNELGHALIKRFGSLANVLETPAEELAKLPGMGINAATFLTLIAQLERYYLMHKNDEKILDSLDDCGKYLANCFRNHGYAAGSGRKMQSDKLQRGGAGQREFGGGSDPAGCGNGAGRERLLRHSGT